MKKKMSKMQVYQDNVDDRVITVCVGSRYDKLYARISICHPNDKDNEIGIRIAENRCESAFYTNMRDRNNKMIHIGSINTNFLQRNRHIHEKIAESIFFHVKHNISNYVSAVN